MLIRYKLLAVLGISSVLILLLKGRFPEPAVNTEQLNEFWISKTHSTGQYSIVVCGDSRVYRGVSIEGINEGLSNKLSGINLGYSGGGFSEAYLDFALSKLDKNAKSKILIVGITPHSLTADAFKEEAFTSYKNLGAFEVARGLYLSNFLKHFAPYKPMDLLGNTQTNYLQYYHKTDGWVASAYVKPDSTEALSSYQKIFTEYQVGSKETSQFLRKLKAITESGISVIAFRPPTTFQMRKLEDSLSGFDEELLKIELEKCAVVWIDFKDSDFETYDGSHLHFNSAKKMSKIMGRRIEALF